MWVVLRQNPLGPPGIWRITKYQFDYVSFYCLVCLFCAPIPSSLHRYCSQSISAFSFSPLFLLQRGHGQGFRERESNLVQPGWVDQVNLSGTCAWLFLTLWHPIEPSFFLDDSPASQTLFILPENSVSVSCNILPPWAKAHSSIHLGSEWL